MQQSRSHEYGCLFQSNDDLGINGLKSTHLSTLSYRTIRILKLKWDDEIAKFNL